MQFWTTGKVWFSSTAFRVDQDGGGGGLHSQSPPFAINGWHLLSLHHSTAWISSPFWLKKWRLQLDTQLTVEMTFNLKLENMFMPFPGVLMQTAVTGFWLKAKRSIVLGAFMPTQKLPQFKLNYSASQTMVEPTATIQYFWISLTLKHTQVCDKVGRGQLPTQFWQT